MRLFLSTALLLAASHNATAFETQFAKATTPGKSILLLGHASVVNNGCLMKPATIAITQQPAHGRLDMRAGSQQIKGGVGIIDRCIGKTGPATMVSYVPQAGFVGTDELRYTVTFPSVSGTPQTRDFHARVLVRPLSQTLEGQGWKRAQ